MNAVIYNFNSTILNLKYMNKPKMQMQTTSWRAPAGRGSPKVVTLGLTMRDDVNGKPYRVYQVKEVSRNKYRDGVAK